MTCSLIDSRLVCARPVEDFHQTRLTEENRRLLMDPEWTAEASTAPGELTNKAHCCGITARVCFAQPLKAGGELTQTRFFVFQICWLFSCFFSVLLLSCLRVYSSSP